MPYIGRWLKARKRSSVNFDCCSTLTSLPSPTRVGTFLYIMRCAHIPTAVTTHFHSECSSRRDLLAVPPPHPQASTGVSTAAAVACALAFMDGLEWANKTGRTPLEIARLEGHTGLMGVLSGMLNRQHNELHCAFEAGTDEEAEQLRLLACRPELAAQKDPHANLPLHLAAMAGASPSAVDECIRIFPDAPTCRNADGFLPQQLVRSPSPYLILTFSPIPPPPATHYRRHRDRCGHNHNHRRRSMATEIWRS